MEKYFDAIEERLDRIESIVRHIARHTSPPMVESPTMGTESGTGEVRVESLPGVPPATPSPAPLYDAENAGDYWSNHEDRRLETLWNQGLSDEEIGGLMGRPYYGVVKRRSTLGLVNHPKKTTARSCFIWSPREKTILRNRLDAGVSLVDIANELDRSPNGVSVMASKMGLLRRGD